MEFNVPSPCGNELDFRRDLSELAGLSSAPLVPTVVRIILAEPALYRLHLEVAGEVREIADPDCRVLLRTAVVIAAAAARGETVTSAPTELGHEPIEPILPPMAPAPEPAMARPDAVIPRVSAAQNPPLGAGVFGVAAGIGISAGILPGASAVLELRAGLDPDPVGLALMVRYWPGSGTERNGRSIHVTGLGGRIATLMSLGEPRINSRGRFAATAQRAE